MTPNALATAQPRLERAEALRELARVRLQPPERERLMAELDTIIAAARQPQNEILRAAQEKAIQAEADRQEKRKPYEADPLFMYLWRRRFGTRDYKASPLVRSFDRKVAHLIGYEEARVNYTLLMELPDRLREHAERLSGRSDDPVGSDPLGSLDAIERRPEVAALISAAAREPGADEPIVRRLIEAGRASQGGDKAQAP